MITEQFVIEKHRRKHLSTRLIAIIIGANILGAFLAVTFFSIHSYVTGAGNDGTYAATGNFIAVLVGVGSILGARLTRPLDRWYHQPEKLLPLTPRVQRLALNNCAISALISLAMWTLAGTLSAWSVRQEGLGAALVVFMGMVGVAGPMTALLIYFALERLWTREIPLFFPDRSPSEIRAFRLSVRRRLFVPSLVGLMSAFVMTLNLIVLVYDYPRLSPTALGIQLQATLYRQGFLLGIAVLAAGALTLTLGRYMADAVEILQQRMTEVRQGQLTVHIPVISNDEFGELAAGFNAMVKGLQQEEIIRRLFSLYVTPEVAEHAIAYGAERGGQLAAATVLFSDIRGFTAMTERLGAEAIIALLNRYFEAMSAAITGAGGLVNKFGGDSLLAVFGTPLNPAEDHAARGIQAAQEMLTALADFNADQRQRGEPELRIGIGIATGAVVVGNVGSAERLEYTVIGDTVNLAARLQALTKDMGLTVLFDAPTAQAIGHSATAVSEIEVRGKEAPVAVFTLLSAGANYAP